MYIIFNKIIIIIIRHVENSSALQSRLCALRMFPPNLIPGDLRAQLFPLPLETKRTRAQASKQTTLLHALSHQI